MKRLLSLLLALVLALSLMPAALAEEVSDPAVAKAQFNIRKEADTNAEIVANVGIGERVTVIGYPNDEWCQVKRGVWTGYAKRSWLRIKKGKADKTAKLAAKGITPAEVAASGLDIGQGDPNEVRYLAEALRAFSIRETPSADARRLEKIGRGKELRVLAYGDDWCHVQTKNGRVTGYAETDKLYHFHSLNRFKWEVPGYDSYRMTGYVVLTQDLHITDSKNLYKGNNLHAGNILFVRQLEDGTIETLLRRDWVKLDPAAIAYVPLVDWRKAKAGDIIGGYTQYFGQSQGGVYYANRKRNIGVAMKMLNEIEVASGAEFRYNRSIGPLTKGKGYVVGGVVGGAGSGMGGGVCHASTLMYQAALSLPFFISEREPHTKDGAHYAPLEFDATVGAYSDLRFYNTLPYGIKLLTLYDKTAGVITVQFQCTETVDESVLATWDGSALDIPIK